MSLRVYPLLSPWPYRLEANWLVVSRSMTLAWACPSDHIPVGIVTFEGVRIISWNVLSRRYMYKIYKNDQGLNPSILTRQHETIVDSSGLTAREDLIAECVFMMMNRLEVVIMCLQECSAELLEALKRRAVDYYFTEMNDDDSQGVVIILNAAKVQQVEHVEVYLDESWVVGSCSVVAVEVTLLSLAKIRIVNVNLPGGRDKKAMRRDFVRAALKPSRTERTIAIGDYSARPETMEQHMQKEEADGVYMCVVPEHPTGIACDQCSQVVDFAICNRYTYASLLTSWQSLPPKEISDDVERWVAPFGDITARDLSTVAVSEDDDAEIRQFGIAY